MTIKSACKSRKESEGFTLIELIVVISIVSIVLVFAVPRIDTISNYDNGRNATNWILLTVEKLRVDSQRLQQQFYINIDIEGQKLWSSNGSMTTEQLEKASEGAYILPEGARIHDVVFMNSEPIGSGVVQVSFSPQGYAQMAIIHLENQEQNELSLVIEPFLQKVIQHEGFLDFEDLKTIN